MICLSLDSSHLCAQLWRICRSSARYCPHTACALGRLASVGRPQISLLPRLDVGDNISLFLTPFAGEAKEQLRTGAHVRALPPDVHPLMPTLGSPGRQRTLRLARAPAAATAASSRGACCRCRLAGEGGRPCRRDPRRVRPQRRLLAAQICREVGRPCRHISHAWTTRGVVCCASQETRCYVIITAMERLCGFSDCQAAQAAAGRARPVKKAEGRSRGGGGGGGGGWGPWGGGGGAGARGTCGRVHAQENRLRRQLLHLVQGHAAAAAASSRDEARPGASKVSCRIARWLDECRLPLDVRLRGMHEGRSKLQSHFSSSSSAERSMVMRRQQQPLQTAAAAGPLTIRLQLARAMWWRHVSLVRMPDIIV